MEEKNKNENLENEEVSAEEMIAETTDEEEVVEDINSVDETELLKNEIAKLKNDYARAYADTENLRKRLNAEAETAKKYRIQSFALDILPVIDNLERALQQEVSEDAKPFYTGVKMIYDQMIYALKKEGVEEIDCLNKPFDPNFHQAIMVEKKEGVESGVVTEVLQKGYKLKDRILRASMVKISE